MTTNTDTCLCKCHDMANVQFYYATNPPIPCCKCPPFGKMINPIPLPIPVIKANPINPAPFTCDGLTGSLSTKRPNNENPVPSGGSEFDKRLETLESDLCDIKNKINNIYIEIQLLSSKKPNNKKKYPHKCPICKGFGNLDIDHRPVKCTVCKEKGILWG